MVSERLSAVGTVVKGNLPGEWEDGGGGGGGEERSAEYTLEAERI